MPVPGIQLTIKPNDHNKQLLPLSLKFIGIDKQHPKAYICEVVGNAPFKVKQSRAFHLGEPIVYKKNDPGLIGAIYSLSATNFEEQ